MKPTYSVSPDKASITCLICGSVSHNSGDVQHLYCAACAIFHGDLQACQWCDEALLPDEPRAPVEPALLHWECGLRAVVGGVNHQRGLCTCCGGTMRPDPENMTRRQAAQLAAQQWMAAHRPPESHACESQTPKDIPPKSGRIQ